jgi:hypothetical protein
MRGREQRAFTRRRGIFSSPKAFDKTGLLALDGAASRYRVWACAPDDLAWSRRQQLRSPSATPV